MGLVKEMAEAYAWGFVRGTVVCVLLCVVGVVGCIMGLERGSSKTIPETPPDTAISATDANTYMVQPGDTLYRIARDHDTTVTRLYELNPTLGAAEALPIGTVLHVE